MKDEGLTYRFLGGLARVIASLGGSIVVGVGIVDLQLYSPIHSAGGSLHWGFSDIP